MKSSLRNLWRLESGFQVPRFSLELVLLDSSTRAYRRTGCREIHRKLRPSDAYWLARGNPWVRHNSCETKCTCWPSQKSTLGRGREFLYRSHLYRRIRTGDFISWWSVLNMTSAMFHSHSWFRCRSVTIYLLVVLYRREFRKYRLFFRWDFYFRKRIYKFSLSLLFIYFFARFEFLFYFI